MFDWSKPRQRYAAEGRYAFWERGRRIASAPQWEMDWQGLVGYWHFSETIARETTFNPSGCGT
jgi:hypothetical protein